MDTQFPYNTVNTPLVSPQTPVIPPVPQITHSEQKFDLKPFLTIFKIGLGLGLLFLFSQIIKPATLTVSGIGKVSTVPQSVSLIVTRTNVAFDSALAIDAGESGLVALINEAKNIVGADAKIEKSFYTTSVTSAQQSSGVVKVFQIANGFKITFNDVSKTNELIKTLYSKGATSISSVSFIPADKDQTERDARKLAIANAKEEAVKIAKSMGKRVGRVVSFADDQVDASSTISSSEGSFGTESIDITKAVSVIYEIW